MTGEELYTKAEFREVFEQQAADIINPDICNCGGILELKEIAAMAEAILRRVVAAQLQQHDRRPGRDSAPLRDDPELPDHRVLRQLRAGRRRRSPSTRSVAENGYITLPTAPGLGIEIDEDALGRYAYQEFRQRTIRYPADERP